MKQIEAFVAEQLVNGVDQYPYGSSSTLFVKDREMLDYWGSEELWQLTLEVADEMTDNNSKYFAFKYYETSSGNFEFHRSDGDMVDVYIVEPVVRTIWRERNEIIDDELEGRF